MSFIAVAIGGSALVGAAAGAYGASKSAGAAQDAASLQAAAANRATDLQKSEYDQTRADQQPWRDAGVTALSGLSNPDFQKSFTAADFTADPGYQFRMDQGQKALERSAAAKGGLQSGGTMKAIADYGQNAASAEYQNAYNRFNQDRDSRFNKLSSIAGTGQVATNTTDAAGANYANNAGANITGAANAAGAAGIAGANAWSNGLSAVGNAGTGAANNWMQYSTMNRYLNNMPLSGVGSSGIRD